MQLNRVRPALVEYVVGKWRNYLVKSVWWWRLNPPATPTENSMSEAGVASRLVKSDLLNRLARSNSGEDRDQHPGTAVAIGATMLHGCSFQRNGCPQPGLERCRAVRFRFFSPAYHTHASATVKDRLQASRSTALHG